MTDRVIAALPSEARRHIEPHLPDWAEVRWFTGKAQALEAGAGAGIAWFDMGNPLDFTEVVRAATGVRWLFTKMAGVDALPLSFLAERGIVLTNCPGLAAPTVSEYVVLGMLSIAKGYREIVQAQARHEWLMNPPGIAELGGSRALLIGYGAIGKTLEARLRAFDVAVTVVRRNPDTSLHVLGPDQWRPRLGEFDWVVLAAPATSETTHLIGAPELAAMKPGAVLVNVARGSLVDQDALVLALTHGRIGGAFLDVTEPEPLPPQHPLWSLGNVHITMHLSGRAQVDVMPRASRRFLDNLARFGAGLPLLNQVDLARGY